MRTEELVIYLSNRIKELQNQAEEYIQDCDDSESASYCFGGAHELKSLIDYLEALEKNKKKPSIVVCDPSPPIQYRGGGQPKEK